MSTDSKTRVVTTYRLAEMKARGEKHPCLIILLYR